MKERGSDKQYNESLFVLRWNYRCAAHSAVRPVRPGGFPVLDDPQDAVRTAREKAQAREWSADRILRELATVDVVDHAFREQCARVRDQLVPSLMKAIHEEDPERSLHAGILLLHLGIPEGADGILRRLRHAEDSTQ